MTKLVSKPIRREFVKVKIYINTNFLPFYSEILNSLTIHEVSKGKKFRHVYYNDEVLYIHEELLEDKNKNKLVFHLLTTLTQLSYKSLIEHVSNKALGKVVAKVLSDAFWAFEFSNPELYEIPKEAKELHKYANKSFKQIYEIGKKLPKIKPNIKDLTTGILVEKALLRDYSSNADGYSNKSMPMDLITIVNKMLNPKIDWSTVLVHKIVKLTEPVKTYSKFSRRAMANGLYLPGKDVAKGVKSLAVYVDTSGSVGIKELEKVYSELHGLFKRKIVSEITIICFDTQVYPEQVITFESNFSDIKFEGGGGTLIKPVLDTMIMLFPPETIHVVFTDLAFDRTPVKKMKVNLNIFWVTESSEKMPKGTMIKI